MFLKGKDGGYDCSLKYRKRKINYLSFKKKKLKKKIYKPATNTGILSFKAEKF